jgi:phosphoribosylformylglycinamidine synthase
MDLKEPGNRLYLIGTTKDEPGGSHYNLVHGLRSGSPPAVDLEVGPRVFKAVHQAISTGLVRACHDLSEGGLAVALAEMAFAGGIGADVTLPSAGSLSDAVLLFAESTTRFVVEVRPERVSEFESCCTDIPFTPLGQTVKEQRLRIAGTSGEWVVWAELSRLKEAWQKAGRW